MLNATHPDDERLSALASRDVDVAADASLIDHLAGCDRCATIVGELTALRSALADLPDLQPSRPLQLLPPAAGRDTDGLGGWVQRLFRPLLTAGAALAIVGLVGTTLPEPMESLFQNVGSELSGGADAQEDSGQIETLASGEAAPAAGDGVDLEGDDERAAVAPAERSPWPMILFTGVAVMIGAALLRWILVPRAG
jgi:hypothetical protein